MQKAARLTAALSAIALSFAAQAEAPKIAVWNPERNSEGNHHRLDLDQNEAVAAALRESGAAVTMLTAGEIGAGALASPEPFDAVFFIGEGFPRAVIPNLQEFSNQGGVLVSIGAKVPFLICMEQDAAGEWQLSPATPDYAWQTHDILTHIGLRYIYVPEKHNQGVRHRPTRLLKSYAPDLPDVNGRIDSRWVISTANAQYVPLIRSFRSDDLDVPGPLYIIRNGSRTSIISTHPAFLLGTSPALWNKSKETLAAVARIAMDIRKGELAIEADDIAQIAVDAPPAINLPLDRPALGSVDPEDAAPLRRWGRFDGSCLELGPTLKPTPDATDSAACGTVDTLPQAIEPGAAANFTIQHNPPLSTNAATYLRVRGAYTQTGAGLKIEAGGTTLWNETFIRIDTSAPENYSANLAYAACEFTRIVFIPPEIIASNAVLRISNPGSAPVGFDAMQLEMQPHPRTRSIGLGAGQDGPNNYPASEAVRWGGLRTSLRTQWVGKPDDTNRFEKMDALVELVSSRNPRIQAILEGTPPWAAISPERLQQAVDVNRPSTVPPDPAKYAEIVEAVIKRHGKNFASYELWNEADISAFYRGGASEYVELFNQVEPVIRRLQPDAIIMPCGMAGVQTEFIDALVDGGVLDASDMIAFHPYAGKSAAWDASYGLLEGYLYSIGQNIEIFCNESGIPSTNLEWFTPPPVLTYDTQRQSLDIAIARILANALPKLSVFYSGGDFDHGYGLFTANGTPKPAYSVFSDYANLNGEGSTRLDISMTRTDGNPISGIYAAASRHADGSATIIVNPSECAELQGATNAPDPIPLRLLLPTLNDRPPEATAQAAGRDIPVRATSRDGCIELSISLAARTVIYINNAPAAPSITIARLQPLM